MRKFVAFSLALFLYGYSGHLLAAADPVKQFGALPKGWVYTGFGADFGVARGSTFNAAVARDASIIWESAVSPKTGIGFKTSNALRLGVSDAVVKTGGAITGARVFAGFRGVMGGPLGVGLLLLPPVIDYLAQEGVRPSQNPSSGQPFEVASNEICSVAPCNRYTISAGGPAFTVSGFNPNSVCSAWIANASSIDHDTRTPLGVLGMACRFTGPTWSGNTVSVDIFSTPTDPSPMEWLPKSMDDIAPYMNPGRATPELMEALLARGGEFETETTSITPPVPAKLQQGYAKFNTVILPLAPTTKVSFYPGPPVFIGDGKIGNGYRDVRVDGVPQFEGGAMSKHMLGTVAQLPTSTIRTQEYDGPSDSTKVTDTTYSPGGTVEQEAKSAIDVTVGTPGGKAQVDGKTTTEVKTTVKDADGNVVSEITQTDKTTAPKDKPDDTFTDKELPDIPPLYERKYPDGIVGIWNEKIVEIKATPLLSLVSGLMPDITSAGACPSWPLALDFATWANFGTRDVAPPCWVWDFGKFIITISALLLARALIFGG